MHTSQADVAAFFADFEQRSTDTTAVADFFDDQFLSLNPATATVVRPEQLAAVLPARAEMFRSIGVSGTRLATVREDEIDENHRLVHTTWQTIFSEPGADPLVLSSSFLLRRTDRGWRIAVYINQADIAEVIAQRRRLSPTENHEE